jgi:hypothetical protein
MKIINFENNKSLIFSDAQSPCAIILINLKGLYIYLLMGLNNYLSLLVKTEGATSISTILLVDGKARSFLPISMDLPLGQNTPKLLKESP